MSPIKKILIIQTAFLGDVILATALLEKLHSYYPHSPIDIMVRKGSETIFDNHPFLNKIIIWDKNHRKYQQLWKIAQQVRKEQYDILINLQRFASTGLVMAYSEAKQKYCFKQNPFSFLADFSVKYQVEEGIHEIDRNQALIAPLTDPDPVLPKLYASQKDYEVVAPLLERPFICIAPGSIWGSKQLPVLNWIMFSHRIPERYGLYTIGSKNDWKLCQQIILESGRSKDNNLAGKLTLIQSALLMKHAIMNYVNDSAPLHLASAMNAPVTAVYCSTVPRFGFHPLSDLNFVVETTMQLSCRPCGLHGYSNCPRGHFNCGRSIRISQLEDTLMMVLP